MDRSLLPIHLIIIMINQYKDFYMEIELINSIIK